MAES
jgi:hypothetical protein